MNLIVKLKFGSHLYGTDTPDSDQDIKGVYLPPARDIVLGRVQQTIKQGRAKQVKERNTKDDIDVEIFSLCRFLELLSEGQTCALDMIFAPESAYLPLEGDRTVHPVWSAVVANRAKLLNRNVNAFVGYARRQCHNYGMKGTRMDALTNLMRVLNGLPDNDRLSQHYGLFAELVQQSSQLVSLEKTPLIEIVEIPGPTGQPALHLHCCGRKAAFTVTVKYAKAVYDRILKGYGERAHKAHLDGGKDYKALSHAVRVNNEAIELLRTGHITFPRPEAQLLKDIKQKKISYDYIATLIEQGLADLHVAQSRSTLPEKPDLEWKDKFIEAVYTNIVVESERPYL